MNEAGKCQISGHTGTPHPHLRKVRVHAQQSNELLELLQTHQRGDPPLVTALWDAVFTSGRVSFCFRHNMGGALINPHLQG